jgi:deazaflavin-dependent oxidoreductase (nitroreductase family)
MTTSTEGPRPNGFQRMFTRFISTPFGGWLVLHVATQLDPLLLRASGGRVHFGRLSGIWVGLLTATGAKSGQPRSVPLLYFKDGGRVVLIGSNVGRKQHPAWVHNLRAHPRAVMSINGQARDYVASEAEDPERERLWAAAESIYSGYRDYEVRAAGRHIPVFVLQPEDG